MRHCAATNHSGAEIFQANRTASPYRLWLQLHKFLVRWDVVVAALLMSLVSFSLPGREGPDAGAGIDSIAAAKFAIRLLVLTWFGVIWLLDCRQSLLGLSRETGLPVSDLVGALVFRGQWTNRVLFPWWIFVAWSLLSVSWSPLFSVSVGQWLGLAALIVFAQVIANRHASGKKKLVFQWPMLAIQIGTVLSAYSLLVIVTHLIAPDASGLNRGIVLDGSNGFFHPTAVGATSSLGLTIAGVLLLQRVVTNIPLVFCMLSLNALLLLLSESRAALAMAVVTGAMCFACLMSWRLRATLVLVGGFGLILQIVIDPGFEIARLGIDNASAYVQRGQTPDELQQVSGRAELWQAVWQQFLDSPIRGHGYFVTSSTGKLDVWEGPSNQDAHNIVLQVLVTTGIVGGLIFMWAILVSSIHLMRSTVNLLAMRSPLANRLPSQPQFITFVVIVSVWFLGWTQGCVSFLGPIRPEAVAFFALLGLLAAHAENVRQHGSSAI